jgi:hypothetical protein
MASHRFTLFALKTFFLKALRHSPPLSTLHQRSADPASPKKKSGETKATGVSMPGQYDVGKGEEEEWEDAPGGDAGDEWEDEHSAVHYPFEDWQEKCRIIPEIPLQYAWVSSTVSCFSSDLATTKVFFFLLRSCTSTAASSFTLPDVHLTPKYVLPPSLFLYIDLPIADRSCALSYLPEFPDLHRPTSPRLLPLLRLSSLHLHSFSPQTELDRKHLRRQRPGRVRLGICPRASSRRRARGW